jgi:hypothetical protein
MSVVESDVPRHSALGKDLIECADFRHAYCAPLTARKLASLKSSSEFSGRPAAATLMILSRASE